MGAASGGSANLSCEGFGKLHDAIRPCFSSRRQIPRLRIVLQVGVVFGEIERSVELVLGVEFALLRFPLFGFPFLVTIVPFAASLADDADVAAKNGLAKHVAGADGQISVLAPKIKGLVSRYELPTFTVNVQSAEAMPKREVSASVEKIHQDRGRRSAGDAWPRRGAGHPERGRAYAGSGRADRAACR